MIYIYIYDLIYVICFALCCQLLLSMGLGWVSLGLGRGFRDSRSGVGVNQSINPWNKIKSSLNPRMATFILHLDRSNRNPAVLLAVRWWRQMLNKLRLRRRRRRPEHHQTCPRSRSHRSRMRVSWSAKRTPRKRTRTRSTKVTPARRTRTRTKKRKKKRPRQPMKNIPSFRQKTPRPRARKGKFHHRPKTWARCSAGSSSRWAAERLFWIWSEVLSDCTAKNRCRQYI